MFYGWAGPTSGSVQSQGVAASGLAELQRGAEDPGEGCGGEGFLHGPCGGDATGVEQEGMAEDRRDFLDVVGYEDEGGMGAVAEAGDEIEKAFARHGVETGAGFIEDEEIGLGHETAGDQDTLAFALGEEGPRAVGEGRDIDEGEEGGGLTGIRRTEPFAEVDGRVAATGDDFEGRFVVVEPLAQSGTDETDTFPEFGPVRLAVAMTEEFEGAGGRGEVPGEGGEQGGLAGAVGAEDDPVLSRGDGPVDVGEEGYGSPGYAEVGHAENGLIGGAGGWGHGRAMVPRVHAGQSGKMKRGARRNRGASPGLTRGSNLVMTLCP